jgi:predicted AlkP superfamily phosphohydrolase/phosphomutase
MAYTILITESAAVIIEGVNDKRLAKKIAKCLALLSENPRHPSLASHRFESFDGMYGEKVRESYVENKAPSAWRIWWFYGPEHEEITVVDIGPHP